jgi:ATP-binding cassette subfamily C (CFTR/MRP) protein 1
LKSIGPVLYITTIVLSIIFQGFSISSNIWLSIWSNDNSAHINGKEDISKRNLYLSVYGLLGFGQGKFLYSYNDNYLFYMKFYG